MFEPGDSWLLPPHSSQLPSVNHMSAPSQLDCYSGCINQGNQMLSARLSMPSYSIPGINPGSMPSYLVSGINPDSIPGCSFPGIAPGISRHYTDTVMPGSSFLGIPNFKLEQSYEAGASVRCLHPPFPTILPSVSPSLKEQKSTFVSGHTGNAAADSKFRPMQKGLVIFDRSGNQTRLIYSSLRSPDRYASTTIMKMASGPLNEAAAKTDALNPTQLILREESDENHVAAEHSEMREDTDEINALLYSDEEDDDDEVMSTGHSPVMISGNCHKLEQGEGITDELSSLNGACKRQKLLSGMHKKSTSMDAASSVRIEGSYEYESDTGTSCAIGWNEIHETGSVLGDKQSRKDKIQTTLKILEHVIPGAKGKDPLFVLDEAIDYLKSLKLKAKSLGGYHH